MNYQHLILYTFVGSLARSCGAVQCYTDESVDTRDCPSVLSQINYAPDGALDTASTSVSRKFGSCGMFVAKPRQSRASKAAIEQAVNLIISSCHGKTGGTYAGNPKSLVWVQLTVPGDSPYDSGYAFNKPQCDYQNVVIREDCAKAFMGLEVHSNLQFVLNRPDADSVTNSVGSCTVNVYTTDGSTLTVMKGDRHHYNGYMWKTFDSLLVHCSRNAGVVNIEGGTNSRNGHVRIETSKFVPKAQPPSR